MGARLRGAHRAHTHAKWRKCEITLDSSAKACKGSVQTCNTREHARGPNYANMRGFQITDIGCVQAMGVECGVYWLEFSGNGIQHIVSKVSLDKGMSRYVLVCRVGQDDFLRRPRVRFINFCISHGHWPMLFPSITFLGSCTQELYLQAAAITTAILDHKPSSWRLSWNITLLAPLYSEILVFGITLYAQTLVIREKGPVFMTAFTPLSTVIAAVTGLLVLGEELHLGECDAEIDMGVGRLTPLNISPLFPHLIPQ
ncbi:hypothetical protein WN944_004549 [Citrus x changshan-huyou]|uniref:WAT1-related protein n=1 Tax=Citrus x changshan-huyou TaxID=2935761 RepID=A0AAP0M591_9ROSI